MSHTCFKSNKSKPESYFYSYLIQRDMSIPYYCGICAILYMAIFKKKHKKYKFQQLSHVEDGHLFYFCKD